VEAHNARLFEEEVARLDRWSDDLGLGLEREIRELDGGLREARRSAHAAPTLSATLDAQRGGWRGLQPNGRASGVSSSRPRIASRPAAIA